MLTTNALLALLTGSAAGQDFETPNPGYSRYFYTPSAIPLEQASGYVSQKEVVFTSTAFGLTDNVALLFGTSIPAALFGFPVMIAGVKVGAQVGDTGAWFGGGAEAFTLPGGVGGLAYLNYTVGNRDSNATVAFGTPFLLGGGGVASYPLFVVAGQLRVSEHVALVTENWLLAVDSFGLGSAGVRLFNSKFSIDLGLIHDFGDFYALPWIDTTWHWQ